MHAGNFCLPSLLFSETAGWLSHLEIHRWPPCAGETDPASSETRAQLERQGEVGHALSAVRTLRGRGDNSVRMTVGRFPVAPGR